MFRFHLYQYVTYTSEDPLINGSVFAKDLREHELYQIRHDLLAEGFPQTVRRWNWIWAKKNMGKSLGMGKTALMTYVCDRINKDFGSHFSVTGLVGLRYTSQSNLGPQRLTTLQPLLIELLQ